MELTLSQTTNFRLFQVEIHVVCRQQGSNLTFFATGILLLADKVLTCKNQLTQAIFSTFLISCVHKVSKSMFSFNFFLDIQTKKKL